MTHHSLLLAVALLAAGCSSDKPHQPRAVDDPNQVGIVAISASDYHLDPGLVGAAASPEEIAAPAQTPAAVPVDLSTPEAAARSYVSVINSGQVQQLAQVLVPDQQPVMAQLGPALAPLTESSAALHNVLNSRFAGHAFVLAIENSAIPADWLKRWTVVTAETDATNDAAATATLKGENSEETTTRALVRTDTTWQVREPELPAPEAVTDASGSIAQLTQAMRGLTARVEAGELADAAAAEQEIRTVLTAAAEAPAPTTELPANQQAEPTAATPPASPQPERSKSGLDQQMDDAAGRAMFGAP